MDRIKNPEKMFLSKQWQDNLLRVGLSVQQMVLGQLYIHMQKDELRCLPLTIQKNLIGVQT